MIKIDQSPPKIGGVILYIRDSLCPAESVLRLIEKDVFSGNPLGQES